MSIAEKQCKDKTLFSNIMFLFVKFNIKNIIKVKFNDIIEGKIV